MSFSESAEPLKLYFKQINKIPPISQREFEYLYKKIKHHDDEPAKKRMVEGNLRLVIVIAMKYQRMGVSLMDLIEEGNLGLMKAIKKYEMRKGQKFSTYAGWWIRQVIRRSLDNNGKMIRIPSYATENIHKWYRAWEQLQIKLGRTPSLLEAAEDMDLSIREVRNVIHAAAMARGISSLDNTMTEDENIKLGDLIEDRDLTHNPEDALDISQKKEWIKNVIGVLNDREREIINARFCLDGNKGKTLAAIGKELHVSRERVRQIVEGSLIKMKKALQRNNIDEE